MLNLLANALRMFADALDPPCPVKVEREKISARYQEALAKVEHTSKLDGYNSKFGFRPGSKQSVIAGMLASNGFDVDATIAKLAPLVGSHPTLTFTQNVGGERQPIPVGTPEDDSQTFSQFGRLRKTAFAVRRSLRSDA
jgi:hypothetical protein